MLYEKIDRQDGQLLEIKSKIENQILIEPEDVINVGIKRRLLAIEPRRARARVAEKSLHDIGSYLRRVERHRAPSSNKKAIKIKVIRTRN